MEVSPNLLIPPAKTKILPIIRNSLETVRDRMQLSIFTNTNSDKGFRTVSKSVTLNDDEQRNYRRCSAVAELLVKYAVYCYYEYQVFNTFVFLSPGGCYHFVTGIHCTSRKEESDVVCHPLTLSVSKPPTQDHKTELSTTALCCRVVRGR